MRLLMNEILSFWFDGDIHLNYKTKWFPSGSDGLQKQADMLVDSRFGAVLDDALNGTLDYWLENDVEHRGHLALIIVLDQFSRHVFRLRGLPSDAEERARADKKALEIAEKLSSIANWSDNFSVSEHVFALMPYRHSATKERLYGVLKSIDERESREMELMELINRFRKQTTRRLQHLEDRSKAEESDDVLERHPFHADESDIFAQGVMRSSLSFFERNVVPKLTEETFPVCISLSGGVDSMVISKILAVLRDSKKIPIGTIAAIHIDYANRKESAAEADFVEEWCKQLNIVFRKRVINEVTRGITDRNEYEKVTRDIRYDMYRTVLKEFGCDFVLFGHHLGDVQENVISNVMRGSSPLDLSGMSECGVTNGVNVWRPLLAHPKSDIYDFAHKYGVPYFKDTTPSWSTRGKLRQKLIPLLLDMYGEGCLRNLTALAHESDAYRDLVHQNVYQPFLSSIKSSPCGILVNVLQYRDQPLCFWKEMLKEIMHSMSMSMVREKAVLNFMERMHRPSDDRWGWLELRKGFHTYLYENGDFCVISEGILSDRAISGRIACPNRGQRNPKSQEKGGNNGSDVSSTTSGIISSEEMLPWNWPSGIQISLVDCKNEGGLEVRLGNWSVKLEWKGDYESFPSPETSLFKRHFQSCECPAQLQSSKALVTVSDILEGQFEYWFAAPLICESLGIWSDVMIMDKKVSVDFHLLSVPALSQCDLRLRLGVPLVLPRMAGNGKEVCASSSNGSTNSSLGYGLYCAKYQILI